MVMGQGGIVRDPRRISAANPMALKVVLGLGAVFVLVLLGVRLVNFAGFARAILDRAPFVLVEPEIPGDLALVAAVAAVPLVFLLPRAWRWGAAVVLIVGALAVVAVAGSLTARDGSNIDHTPLARMLQSRGYSRCPAGDRIRGSGRATRGEYVARGWAQPGVCPALPDKPDHAR